MVVEDYNLKEAKLQTSLSGGFAQWMNHQTASPISEGFEV
jgi:hypothetical protein